MLEVWCYADCSILKQNLNFVLCLRYDVCVMLIFQFLNRNLHSLSAWSLKSQKAHTFEWRILVIPLYYYCILLIACFCLNLNYFVETPDNLLYKCLSVVCIAFAARGGEVANLTWENFTKLSDGVGIDYVKITSFPYFHNLLALCLHPDSSLCVVVVLCFEVCNI